MSARWDTSATTLVNDLRRIFANRLLSLVVYGRAIEGQVHAPLTSFVLVSSLSQDDLEACAALAGAWTRLGIATPLILPDKEFQRSLDAFPLEYADIVAAHVRVFGPDPFERIQIAPEDLRRACEKQAKSHLLHLREGYIEAGGAPHAIAELVTASTPAFAALLRNVGRLLGVTATSHAAAASAGAHAVGLSDAVVSQVLSLDRDQATRTADGARLFPGYLTAVEQLAHAVDTWRP